MANTIAGVGRVPRCRACRLPGGPGRRLIAGPNVYICEACLTVPATRDVAAERCSFCGRRDVPIAGAWPSLAICAPCAELARGVLAEDDRQSDPPPDESPKLPAPVV